MFVFEQKYLNETHKQKKKQRQKKQPTNKRRKRLQQFAIRVHPANLFRLLWHKDALAQKLEEKEQFITRA